jgi:hypothetical protein
MLAAEVIMLGMATVRVVMIGNNDSEGDEVGNCENSESNW